MAEIKNLEYEDGITEHFALTVQEGEFAGTYPIEKPDGWDSIDCILNINDKFFNVDDFILGDTQKFAIVEYYDAVAFNLIQNVYDRYGGDGKILFTWTAAKDGETFDILGDGYQLNLNKYELKHEQSCPSITLELKKRESNNKLLTREDVSVDLFSDKDLDDNPITPVETVDFYYKERDSTIKDFYYFLDDDFGNLVNPMMAARFFYFAASDPRRIGSQGYGWAGGPLPGKYDSLTMKNEPFVRANTTFENISAEFSNMEVLANLPFNMFWQKKVGTTVIDSGVLETSEPYTNANGNFQRIKIVNKQYHIGSVIQGQDLYFYFATLGSGNTQWYNQNAQASIEIVSRVENALRKAKMVRLSDAIKQLARLYTGAEKQVESTAICGDGPFANTAISTGLFLRGLSDLYLKKKLKTSLKNVLYDGAAPLMALGFDVMDDAIRVETVDYFFKDVINYDFSDKSYVETETRIGHDIKFSFNELAFGSKKFSSGTKGDLLNFNTKMEALTPIESVKQKFDKLTDFIIDDFKIQNIIQDTSTSSKNSDDDLVAVDLVKAQNFIDSAVLTECTHLIEGGRLTLVCYTTPFDTIPITVGQNVTITSGMNAGTWQVLSIDRTKMSLSKNANIQTGTIETPIEYVVSNVLKNRTEEGFYSFSGVDNIDTTSNLRHNTKFHMARWYGYFGGGMVKKSSDATIKVTDYTNNGAVTIERGTELWNEISGPVTLDAAETLERLTAYKMPYFNGEEIETIIENVSFAEFFTFYNNWRYGNSGESKNSRGFVRINTPVGVKDVYIFGDGALSYDRAAMELTLKGKIKNGAVLPDPPVDNPDDGTPPPPPPKDFYTEVMRDENTCGISKLQFELGGDATVEFALISEPMGGSFTVKDANTNAVLAERTTDGSSAVTLTGNSELIVELKNADRIGNNIYRCRGAGEVELFYATMSITITGAETVVETLTCEGFKFNRSGGPFVPNPDPN